MSKQWTQVIPLVAIPKDDVVAVNALGKEIALYSVGDEIYATDNACSHGNARLCDGFLDGHEPLTSDIQAYSVKVENCAVFVAL